MQERHNDQAITDDQIPNSKREPIGRSPGVAGARGIRPIQLLRFAAVGGPVNLKHEIIDKNQEIMAKQTSKTQCQTPSCQLSAVS